MVLNCGCSRGESENLYIAGNMTDTTVAVSQDTLTTMREPQLRLRTDQHLNNE